MESNGNWPAHAVLELARWAPSGDNSQPWRFVVHSPYRFDIAAYDTSACVVYDLDAVASELAHGILLETVRIAATRLGLRAQIDIRATASGQPRIYAVSLEEANVEEDPLCDWIERRTVQRRAMRPIALSRAQEQCLQDAVNPFRIEWFRKARERHQIAALCMRSARIRLTIREAYEVHRAVIAWRSKTSPDRLPDASLGADRLLLWMMRTAMVDWERMKQVNRMFGTLLPRFELDYVPGFCSSAYVAVIAGNERRSLESNLAGGAAIQRLWLTAESLGLQMQPQYTPLVFARYVRDERRFTQDGAALRRANRIERDLAKLLGETDARRAIWLARLGPARCIPGRSLRRPLSELVVASPPPTLPPLPPLT